METDPPYFSLKGFYLISFEFRIPVYYVEEILLLCLEVFWLNIKGRWGLPTIIYINGF